MSVGQKIKQIRQLKGFTQENMAEKLDISVNSYWKIENEETDINFSRLEQISTVLGMDLVDMLSFGEKTVYYKANFIAHNLNNSNFFADQNLAQENKFLKEKIGFLEKEIESLKSQIQNLQEINALLKNKKE